MIYLVSVFILLPAYILSLEYIKSGGDYMANENGWGGKRENQTGRPKQEIVRKMRSTRAFDDEWELTKSFLDLIKSGHMEECKAFVKTLKAGKINGEDAKK